MFDPKMVFGKADNKSDQLKAALDKTQPSAINADKAQTKPGTVSEPRSVDIFQFK